MQIALVVLQLIEAKQAQAHFEEIQSQFAPGAILGFDAPFKFSYCQYCGDAKFYSWDKCRCESSVRIPKKKPAPKVSLKKLSSRSVRSNQDDFFEFRNYNRSCF